MLGPLRGASGAKARERDAAEAARTACFELLRQLQGAVRTIVLTATVNNSCVRCSDSLCLQFFRVVRACFLAGRRRTCEATAEDLLFLLVVPELASAFPRDFHFLAYLFINKVAASFTRHLFADAARMAHFYLDFSIMRDEELNLAFVSSLLALESANFHPDTPGLARCCLAASLEDLNLLPDPWPPARPGEEKKAGKGSEKQSQSSGLNKVAKNLGGELLTSLMGSRPPPMAAPIAEIVEAVQALGEEEEAQDWPRQPLLHLSQGVGVFVLEEQEEAAKEPLEAEEQPREEEEIMEEQPVKEEESGESGEESDRGEESWRAADFAQEVRDAFGLDPEHIATEALEESEFRSAISLRDLAGLASLAAARGPRQPTCVRRRRLMAPVPAGCLPEAQPGQPRSRPPWLGSLCSEEGSSGGSGGEEDEIGDAVASLQGLWGAARRESAKRLMRSAGSEGLTAEALRASPSSLPLPVGSKRSSPASSTAATPRDSTPPSASAHCGERGGSFEGKCGGLDGGLSDSESERSSGQSVSSSSLNTAPAPCPTPFGVHLEWHLRLRPRLDRGTQVAQQRGCCPGCKERLPPATIFNAPRYCHYLGCYFCTACHHGELRVIPARVAERWDFEPRKVCTMSAKYLDSQVSQPLVPITRIRRTKISSQATLTETHSLRQRLCKLLEVVASAGCGYDDILGAIAASQLQPHLVQGAELYSMQDLILIEQQGRAWPPFGRLSRLVHMGVEHARVCQACQGKAHFCAICAAEEPLWAFQVEDFYACPECGAAYHRACFLRAGKECPFCLRLRATERRPSIAPVRAR